MRIRPARLFGVILYSALCATTVFGHAQRVTLFPQLAPGNVFVFDVSYSSENHTKTQGPLITAEVPGDTNIEVRARLRLEILDMSHQNNCTWLASCAVIHARTRFYGANAANAPGHEASEPQSQGVLEAPVEFTLLPDGQIDAVRGLDALSVEKQQAWQEWASRFTLAMAIRGPSVKVGQKWTSVQRENSSSPIAGLLWVRESTYVRDESCAPMNITTDGDPAPSNITRDTCAVILTTATLKQQSSPKNATPEAFQIRELRTTGNAHGRNRIITYISCKTGLIVRATEEAQQDMDVTIAKADRSNHVHYTVTAKSHSEVLLLSDAGIARPANDE